MANEDRKKSLDKAIKEIEKQHGKGSVMVLGDDKLYEGLESISSGSLQLDDALGIGGYPKGRIIEIYGPESSGKTTLALHAIAEAQKHGYAAFIDAEHALDPGYARNLGVDVDNLLLSQPDTGEQALEITEALIRSEAVSMVVVDSVAALVPEAEIRGEMGSSHIGLQARLMSQAMRKLSGAISKSNTICVFINQIREKVGVMFGNPETTPGGRALKFYSSIRVEIRRNKQIKEGSDVIGNKAKIKVVKNKVAPPFKQLMVDIIYGKGVSKVGEIIDLGVEFDIIEKAGSWYSYGEDKIGQGRQNSIDYLVEHKDILDELETKIREKLGI
ncbi:MAG: recombinase RecA [Candidatus Izimaplasma sp.]|nr:recombinase RecA [Candidatus Izimaplasma bacterium]